MPPEEDGQSAMGFFDKILNRDPKRPDPSEEAPRRRWTGGGGLEVSLFVGEIVDAPAEAICTSTNPRLSLGGGTGRAVIEETGWELKRRLETVVEEEARRTGRDELPVGFTYATPGGRAPHRLIIHCVACDRVHRSSAEGVYRCVTGALGHAEDARCESLALPVFGTGHARLPFDVSIRAIAEALRDASPSTLRRAWIILFQADRAARAAGLLDEVLGGGRDEAGLIGSAGRSRPRR